MQAEQYIRNEIERFLKSKGVKDLSLNFEKPKQKQFGDLSTNIAMQMATILKANPRQIATEIQSFIPIDPQYIEKIDIAGPGFLNFFISPNSFYIQLYDIIKKKEKYGQSDQGKGIKTQVEFISANPTGPLTIGHGRQAVLGDSIARLFETIGYNVTREYYFNDAGRQMRILGDSVRLRYLQQLGEKIEFPDDYYQGDYIIDIARQIRDENGEKLKKETNPEIFTTKAEEEVFKDIKNTIARLNFRMDVFYNEKSLYDEGKIDEVVSALGEKGLVDERDGAVWFLTSKLGKEQDRVIIKSSGEPTYRLPDIAYHVEKIKRGFELIIDIFGADHIDTYPDVLLAVKALGYDESKIKVLIHQFVTLMEGTEKVKMSTRKANFVTLDELIDEVGEDVTRFFFLMRHMNSHLNFDLTLAKTQSDENPVFYVQYAHARICSIVRFGQEKNITFEKNPELTLLDSEEELDLIKHLIDFPATVEYSAHSFEPHRLVHYLIDTATLFHKFYTICRVISDDTQLTQARLALCEATRVVIYNGCQILGITAPEKM
ncbi:MAG: arginine--tRNA ligase [Calditrichia bacterium]|nr:arginine--tRNA ligase [Calditrichia bacterium]